MRLRELVLATFPGRRLGRSIAVLAASACLQFTPAFATDWDGNGGTGGDFATAINWVGDVLPGSGDIARINSNSSAASPVTFAAGTMSVSNINLGPTTASFLTVNGGNLKVANGDFLVGVGATPQSVFTLSSGTVEFGTAGVYTDGNDLDIGKNGNGRYVQTGGTLMHHADDFKIADSAGGTGVADVSGGNLWVADGFSISDNAGGTGTLNLSGNAVVVSGNSGGLGSPTGTTAEGYISVANNGGTGALNITDNAALYGAKLEYRGEPGASSTITVGGTGGKLIISREQLVGFAGLGGSNQNVIGEEPGATGQVIVKESGLLGVDNPTDVDFSDGFTIGRNGGSGSLAVSGTNARFITPQRLLLGSGGGIDFAFGDQGFDTPGTGSLTIGAGGHVAVSELHVGTTGVGTVTQTGGSVSARNDSALFAAAGFANGTKSEDVFIGSLPDSNGTYNHSGGSIDVGDDFIIGDWGTGEYNMSGTAEVIRSGWTVVANQAGSTGTWNMSGGTFNQEFGDLEIGDEGTGTVNFTGGTINVSGYTAVGHRGGSGRLNISGTAILNTPDLKILMGKELFTTQSGVLKISGDTAQINVANSFTMDESFIGNENKIIADLTTGGITTIDVGTTASIDQGTLEVVSDPGVYQPAAGDQFVLIDAAGGFVGGSEFASVTVNVTLANPGNEILLRGTGFSGAGGSANRYELRVTARGDFNGDFRVDAADLAVLESNFGTAGSTYAQGDANQDGRVTGSDFLLWQRNFGNVGTNVISSAVPEPAALAMVLVAIASGGATRRRR
jgi:hypothetical protein